MKYMRDATPVKPAPSGPEKSKGLFKSQGYTLTARDKSNAAIQRSAEDTSAGTVKPVARNNMLKT